MRLGQSGMTAAGDQQEDQEQGGEDRHHRRAGLDEGDQNCGEDQDQKQDWVDSGDDNDDRLQSPGKRKEILRKVEHGTGTAYTEICCRQEWRSLCCQPTC